MKSSRFERRNGDQRGYRAAAVHSSCSLSVSVYGRGLLYSLEGFPVCFTAHRDVRSSELLGVRNNLSTASLVSRFRRFYQGR